MKLLFAGAAREVTGACTYVEGEKKFLVDCGLFQGESASSKNLAPFPFDPRNLDFVLITHAHLDHIGRLPRLVKLGFLGKIFATPPTTAISRFILEDTLSLMVKGEVPEIFNEEDLKKTLSLFVEVNYNIEREIGPISFIFRDAGHILGSSFIEMGIEGKKLLFSGDLGNSPSLILSPPEKPSPANIIILEATYGNRVHDDSLGRIALLHKAIDYILKTGGTLLIPAFAVERTQELLFIFDILSKYPEISKIPVYLDSPLAIDITAIFRAFPDFLRPMVADKLLFGKDDPFDFPRLKLIRSEQASKDLNNKPGPRVIIAGSGMMEGGRIQHHLLHLLSDPKNLLFVPCFQAKGTLGRKIVDGAKELTLFDKKILVLTKVIWAHSYSSHADCEQILHWVKKLSPQKIFCNHGEESALLNLKKELSGKFSSEIIIPYPEEEFEI